jgi:hypothetical protein
MIPTAFLTVSVDKIWQFYFCFYLIQNAAHSMAINVSDTIMQPQISDEVGCG